ncbi:MAG: glycosyltransferase family 39 protein [bacterium]|nr:glycosyltransferase family 39 protein [bacterium]
MKADNNTNVSLSGLTRALAVVAVVAAGLYIVTYLAVALLRLPYPFELEFMEGDSVDQVWRVLHGLPLYAPPSVDFVPAMYPPLYYYASAAFASVTGLGFLPLRIVSLLASLACFALIGSFVWKQSRDRLAALLAVGLFAATYAESGAWFDTARVDTLMVAFMLGAVWLAWFATKRGHVIASAILCASAIFTKQSAILLPLALLTYLLLARRKHAVFFGAAFAVAFGVPLLLFEGASHGWFGMYAVTIPAAHPWDRLMLISFWTQDILMPLPIAFAIALFYLILYWRGENRDRARFLLLAGAAMMAAAYAPRVKAGNFDNDLIPAYAFLTLVFGIALAGLRERMRVPEDSTKGAGEIFSALLMLLVVVQFTALVYHPAPLIPSAQDREAGDDLVRQVRSYEGEVWVAYHGYLATLAGKTPLATMQPMQDLLVSSHARAKEMLRSSVEEALREKRFDAILLNEPWPDNLRGLDRYEAKRAVFADTSSFWPVTGFRTRPELVYEPAAVFENSTQFE